MAVNKNFYIKSKSFDLHVKILFVEIKLYIGSFLRAFFSLFVAYNYVSFFKLICNNKEGNVLIIELNNFHSEIFPAWLFYLKGLSYDNKIFFVAPKLMKKDRPFDLMRKKDNCGYFFHSMNPSIIRWCFKFGLFSKYKRVIFNSDIFYNSAIDDKYSQLFEIFKDASIFKNVISYSHLVLDTIGNCNSTIDPQKQLMTISPSISKDTGIKFVSPIYNNNSFEVDSHRAKIFDKQKIFTSCGNIKVGDKDSKNLFKALRVTQNEDKNAMFNLVGKAPKILPLTSSVRHYKDRLSCVELKSILQESHFILFLLTGLKSYRYKFNSSSGNLPLALNFNLIPIIEDSFADFYCLNETNAILYKEGELDLAIKRVCNMKYSEYLELQSSLNSLKLNLQKNSLKNIEFLLG